MALNYGYNPYGTAGYGYNYTPPYYQTPTGTQTLTQNTNEIFVNGIEDVRNRALPVNSNYIFLDNDKALLYEKIVDARGQFEVKTYEIHEIKGLESPKTSESESSSTFATKGDLEALQGEIEGLKKQFKASLQSQVDNLGR